MLDGLLAEREDDAPVWGVGIGLPGPFEFDSGRPVAPPIMPGWNGYDVRAPFVERYGALSKSTRGTVSDAAIWQRHYQDYPIDSDAEYARLVDYVHNDPLRHGFCRQMHDWPWSSLHRFVASGLIVGESLWGVLNAGLIVAMSSDAPIGLRTAVAAALAAATASSAFSARNSDAPVVKSMSWLLPSGPTMLSASPRRSGTESYSTTRSAALDRRATNRYFAPGWMGPACKLLGRLGAKGDLAVVRGI